MADEIVISGGHKPIDTLSSTVLNKDNLIAQPGPILDRTLSYDTMSRLSKTDSFTPSILKGMYGSTGNERKGSIAEELRQKTVKYHTKIRKNRVQLAIEKIRKECLEKAALGKGKMVYYSPFPEDVVDGLRLEGLTYRYDQGTYIVEWESDY